MMNITKAEELQRIEELKAFIEAEDKQKPLAISDDGVELFEGDIFYSAVGDCEFLEREASRFIKFELGRKNGFKYFSTKQAAIDHVISEYKGLSLKEVIDAIRDSSRCVSAETNLINLIKTKLKL